MTGLEALKVVERDCEDLEQVPYGEFAIIEKSLKALEIIKEKNVAVAMLKSCGFVKAYNIIAFDEEYAKDKNYARKLTEDEFELLRSVLE